MTTFLSPVLILEPAAIPTSESAAAVTAESIRVCPNPAAACIALFDPHGGIGLRVKVGWAAIPPFKE